MRIKKSKSKNSISYSIIKDYTKNGKRSTKIVNKIGNIKYVTSLAEAQNITIEQWLKNYLNEYIKQHTEKNNKVIIEKHIGKIIPKNQKNTFNIGYLFLKNIYYDLKLNEICEHIENKYRFKFNLNDILSYIIYSRILFPASKVKTHELAKKFIYCPNIKLENMYRGLTYLNNEMYYIQEKIYENSLNVMARNSRVVYFDCTNYYFETYEENDFQRYGINKQHQPKPQVGMGLFMDGDGIPLAMNIYPGNENETKQLIDTENKIVNKFKLNDSRIVICTDAAMCTDEIKHFNIQEGRGFVITQSIKKLKKEYQKKVFEDENWRIVGNYRNTYNINDIQNDEKLYKRYYDTLFYKIIPTETKSVKQDLIVTFSIKYKEYHRNIRNSQIERANRKISENTKHEKLKLKTNPNDFRRFIKEDVSTKQGEKADEYYYSIDEEIIKNEEQYDGYYGITTNLNDDIKVILRIIKGRWEIEESFRIMKSDFKARPVNLSRQDRITAHFLTCYISLLIYRILEKKLNYNYTTSQILDTLKNMYVSELKGDGYIPSYERTDLTDELHEIFGFRTDYEIMDYNYLKKIFNKIKNTK